MIKVFSAVLYTLYFILIAAFTLGWVMNLVKVIQTLSDPITGMFIARLFGTIAFPLGAVLGYF